MKRLGLITTLCAMTAFIVGVMVYRIVKPGYTNPLSRMSTSKLGYVSVMRKLGKPFPVETAVVTRREMTGRFVGEGLVRTEPIQVPVIPMARILRVHAHEGQWVKKGQLLAELDDTKARIKIEACRAAIKIAENERTRADIGTAYVLDQERPERDKIRRARLLDEHAIREAQFRMQQELRRKGVTSEAKFLESKLALVETKHQLLEIEHQLDKAERGRVHSMEIAAAAIEESTLSLQHRLAEIKDYKIFAPCDGLIERCLIHEMEYNQDPGKPAFLMASGQWFEAYLDQTAIDQFQVGDAAAIRLEARPGTVYSGRVNKIHPFVSYNLGGPETSRPIRPLGTGAPEWPATFCIEIEFNNRGQTTVPGLTGFARIESKRETLTVPRTAVTTVSGRRGFVFVMSDNGEHYELREVTLGFENQTHYEVVEGLDVKTRVVSEGHEILEPGDRIVWDELESAGQIASWKPSSTLGIDDSRQEASASASPLLHSAPAPKMPATVPAMTPHGSP